MDIAKDFTALIIISEFDDIFAASMEGELARTICQNLDKSDKIYGDLFIIETTTSQQAKKEKNMMIRYDPVFDQVNQNRRR